MIRANSVRCSEGLLCFVFLMVCAPLALANGPDVIKASHNDVSSPLSQMAVGGSSKSGGSDSQTITARSTGAAVNNPNTDPVAAPLAGPLTGVTLLSNFDGQSAQDNRNVFGFAFVPPDTNGSVGDTQFVQS